MSNQFVIIAGEMRDVDYTSVYGPFDTEAEAETQAAAMITSGVIEMEPDNCQEYRIVPILNPDEAVPSPLDDGPDTDDADDEVFDLGGEQLFPIESDQRTMPPNFTTPQNFEMPDFQNDDDMFAFILKTVALNGPQTHPHEG